MPFRSSFYYITAAFLTLREATLAPPYALHRTKRPLVITRLLLAFLSLLLAIFPTIFFLLAQIEGEAWTSYFILAVALFSFAVAVLPFGIFRALLISALASLTGFLLVLLAEALMPFRTSGREWLFDFFLFDLFLLLLLLVFFLLRLYRRRHFLLLADMSRNGVSYGVNLSPPRLSSLQKHPDAFSLLYTVTIHLSGREDGFHFRQTVASDLSVLLRRRKGHLLLCSLVLSEDVFRFVFYGSPRIEKAVRRFFSSRASSFSVEKEEDPDFRKGNALLPTMPEIFRMYNEFFFYLAESYSFAKAEHTPISFFAAFPDKADAAAFVLETEKNGFHLIKTELSAEDPEANAPIFGIREDATAKQIPDYRSYVVLEKELPFAIFAMHEATDRLSSLAEENGGELITWDVFLSSAENEAEEER